MMHKNRNALEALTVVGFAAALGVMAAGCGGKEVQREAKVEQSQANHERQASSGQMRELGEPISKEDEARIRTQREVTRTITSESAIPTVRQTTIKADINRMAPEHFMALGLNQKQANDIVSYREEHGEFKSVDDLQKVEGLSGDALSNVKSKLGVGPTK